MGKGILQNVVWYLVKTCCERVGLEHIAPNDLHGEPARSCATTAVGSWSRFSSCSGMSPCRQRSGISAASRSSEAQ